MSPTNSTTARPSHLAAVADAALAAVPEPTQPSTQEATSYLVCDECDLSSGPMQAAEAAFLVRIHDQVQHRGRPTARVDDPGADRLVA